MKISDLFNIKSTLLEIEIITLQLDLALKARELEDNFWKYVSRERYPNIKKFADSI